MKQQRQQGFTLIELMVAITILAILIVLSFPDYSQWILNTRIRNAAESIQNGLRLARNEAVQRNTRVKFELKSATTADWTVCVLPTIAITTCAAAQASSADNVLQVFNSAGGATNVQIGASTAVGAYGTPISGGLPAGVTFNGLGRPATVARIDATAAPAASRRLVTTVMAGGEVRMCDPALALSVSPQGCQ